jgi:hypothetical protein
MRADTSIHRWTYRLAGASVAADRPLPGLMADVGPPAADIDVDLTSPGPLMDSPSTNDDKLWPICERLGTGYAFRFARLATFAVDGTGSHVRLMEAAPVPFTTISHLLIDQVLPLVFTMRGRHMLHAAAVGLPGGVCAFLGASGAGKSTLAAACHAEGHPVLTDDCAAVAIRGAAAVIEGLYPGLRLWTDTLAQFEFEARMLSRVAHDSDKYQVHLPLSSVTEQRLTRIYVLHRTDPRFSPASLVSPLPYRERFLAIVQALFHVDDHDAAALKRQFEFVERVVSTIPVQRLHVPDDLTSAVGIVRALAADTHRAFVETA